MLRLPHCLLFGVCEDWGGRSVSAQHPTAQHPTVEIAVSASTMRTAWARTLTQAICTLCVGRDPHCGTATSCMPLDPVVGRREEMQNSSSTRGRGARRTTTLFVSLIVKTGHQLGLSWAEIGRPSRLFPRLHKKKKKKKTRLKGEAFNCVGYI